MGRKVKATPVYCTTEGEKGAQKRYSERKNVNECRIEKAIWDKK